MKGIAREKPPKYINIWDIDQVLGKFKTMPNDKDSSLKELFLKTVMLLGLISPNQGGELTDLDLDLILRTNTT